MSERRPDRAHVSSLLGDPTDQIGSVNDPRVHEEHGQRWNEKWVYPPGHGEEGERVVLWNRYDFLGVFVTLPDGSVHSEPLPE
ncbi:MAG: hypothetical protein ABFS46_14425 [Myxococcota bacterium]